MRAGKGAGYLAVEKPASSCLRSPSCDSGQARFLLRNRSVKILRGEILRGLVTLVAIALIVGAGLCGPDEGQATGDDLCSSVVAIAALPLLPIFSATVTRCAPARIVVHYETSLEPTAPPPKV